ncbi:F-box domain-containing protein [Favolaschia claudopus]|uniref:F-box domain-containing protein n=1 Tax=Favolaschia claudopus TaxID=2862362 RepID=A0AAW0B5B0_9AGAR
MDTATVWIHGLPAEILILIFSCCCRERYTLHASLPLALSHVCRLWRDVAYSVPSLWASFSLFISSQRRPPDNQGLLFLLRLHLEQSAAHPLSFHVSGVFKDPHVSPAASVLDLIAALVDHSDRWLNVKIPLKDALAPIYNRLCGRINRLESLDLRVHGIPGNLGVDCTYFGEVPHLRHLGIGSSLTFQMPFPSNQLTSLHLGAASTMDMCRFMTHCPCPQLTSLTLNPHLAHSAPLQILPPFLHLKTLILAIRDGYSRNPVIDVLEHLTTPSLERLEVVGLREIQLPARAFEAFIQRSGCTLRCLAINFKDFLPFPLLKHNLHILSASLTHLSVLNRGKTSITVDLILRSLTVNNASTDCLLPNLLCFEVHAPSFRTSVLDFVASRRVRTPGISMLMKLILHNSPETETDRARLESLCGQGLVLLSLPPYKMHKSDLFT